MSNIIVEKTIDTIKWTGGIINYPVNNVINPALVSITPVKLRELIKILSNLSFNFIVLLNSKSGFKTLTSWIKSSEYLSLCISSPESRILCNETYIFIDMILKLLNTELSKSCVKQFSVLSMSILDAISSKHCKDFIQESSKHIINTIELLNSKEGEKMIKEFHSKYNDALREDYDNFGIQEVEMKNEDPIKIIQEVKNIKKEQISILNISFSCIFIYFFGYGIISWLNS